MKKYFLLFIFISTVSFSQYVKTVEVLDLSVTTDSVQYINMKSVDGRLIDVFFSTLNCNDAVLRWGVSNNDSTMLDAGDYLWTEGSPITLDKTNADYTDKINTDQHHFGIETKNFTGKYLVFFLDSYGSCTSGSIIIQY